MEYTDQESIGPTRETVGGDETKNPGIRVEIFGSKLSVLREEGALISHRQVLLRSVPDRLLGIH